MKSIINFIKKVLELEEKKKVLSFEEWKLALPLNQSEEYYESIGATKEQIIKIHRKGYENYLLKIINNK